MLVIRAQEMRDIDKRAIEDYKIPGIVLMENAALAVLGFMEKTFKIDKNDSILISAGTGNNGGDGYALARLLVDRGYRASLFIIGDREPKGDAGLNLRILERLVEDQE
ncbi:MAG: NAD(P)H-hydrate epimerase, partial [Caldicoprobacterales bacterium]